MELADTIWNPTKQCLEETAMNDDNLMENLYGYDSLADWEEVDSLNVPTDIQDAIAIDLSLLFNSEPRTEGGFDDNQSLATMKTGTSNATGMALGFPRDLPSTFAISTDPSTSSQTSGLTSTGSGLPKEGPSSQRAGAAFENG